MIDCPFVGLSVEKLGGFYLTSLCDGRNDKRRLHGCGSGQSWVRDCLDIAPGLIGLKMFVSSLSLSLSSRSTSSEIIRNIVIITEPLSTMLNNNKPGKQY